VQIFTCLVLHNKIQTTDNLTKRGFQISNMCHLGRAQQETVQHLFQECAYTVIFRDYLLQIMSNRYSQLYQMASTKEILLSTHFNIYWKNLEVTIIFELWHESSRRIFAQKQQDRTQTVREILTEIRNWFHIWARKPNPVIRTFTFLFLYLSFFDIFHFTYFVYIYHLLVIS
jgi:zinc-binding in reverse transcriptase